MNIIYTSYAYWPPDFGGGMLITLHGLAELAARGHQVTVLTAGKPDFASQEIRDQTTVRRSPFIGDARPMRLVRRIIFAFWVLWRLLRTPRGTAVHIGTLSGININFDMLIGWIAAFIVRLRGGQTIYVFTLAESEKNALELGGLQGFMKRKFLKAMTRLVAISPGLRDAGNSLFPGKTALVPRAVREDVFKPLSETERRRVRAELNLSADDTVFVFLGTVGYRKGFDLLADAFAALSTAHPNWKLLVVGPFESKDNRNVDSSEVESFISRLEGNQQVNFVGRIDDWSRVAELLACSDVFVFPSRREGFGQAVIQAMAAGLPVIVARLPGITDVASIEGETGLYIPPGNALALQEAMNTLGQDDTLRRRMGAQARLRAVAGFGWQQYVDKWEALYAGRPFENDN